MQELTLTGLLILPDDVETTPGGSAVQFQLASMTTHCYSATLNVSKVTLAELNCQTHDSPLKIFQLFFMLPPCSAPQTRSFPTWKLRSCRPLKLEEFVEVHRGTSWDPWLIFPQVASTFFMLFSISDIWLWSHVFKLVSVASCETQQQRWRLSLQMAGNQALSTMVTSSTIITPSPCQRGIKI